MSNETTKHLIALKATINAEFDAWTAVSPENSQLRAIATAIFKTKNYYASPDEIAMGVPGAQPAYFANGTLALRYPLQPAWATYLNEARAALEAVESASSGRAAA